VLSFDVENHKYYWNNKEVPSVSQILKKIGITRDYEQVDEYYRQRGVFVHQAIQYYVKGTLDEESLDGENVLPYVRAFQDYEQGNRYVARKTEVPLYSEKYGFAGTIDQIGCFDTKYETDGITDLKVTENSDKAADLQLCGYAVLYHENFGEWPAFRLALELHGDKTAKPIFYKTNPQKLWEAVMVLYHWKVTRRSKHGSVSN